MKRIPRHNQYRDLLSASIDGRLMAKDQPKLDRHLASCAECRNERISLQWATGLLKQSPALVTPRSFRLSAVPAPAARSLAWPMRAAMAGAALAAVVLAAVFSGDLAGLFNVSSAPANGSELRVQPGLPDQPLFPTAQRFPVHAVEYVLLGAVVALGVASIVMGLKVRAARRKL